MYENVESCIVIRLQPTDDDVIAIIDWSLTSIGYIFPLCDDGVS